jgi:quercetin dioxygenase-like cupin family protein
MNDPIRVGPITMTYLVEGDDSNGSVSVARCDVVGGGGVPLPHFHDAFEETLHGLVGTVTITVDGADVPLGPGDTLCIKRGSVHSFFCPDPDGASFLAISTPGVFGSAYFRELSTALADNGGLPDPVAFGAIMRRHGLTPVPA